MSAPGPPQRLTLLSRAYCRLCDDMQAALAPLAAHLRVEVAVIDVDTHPALEARYGERVPVLFAGAPESGVELCHFRLDAAAVLRALGDASTSRG